MDNIILGIIAGIIIGLLIRLIVEVRRVESKVVLALENQHAIAEALVAMSNGKQVHITPEKKD